MEKTPPIAALFAELRDALASQRDLAKWQEPLSEIARIHYETARRADAAEEQFEESVRVNDRLDLVINVLKHENAKLRDGPKTDDPEALLDRLQKSVARLTLNMKKARAEEGGLYCGNCGASIADNAQGIEALRDRIKGLKLDLENAKSPTAECFRCKVDSGPVDAEGLCSYCRFGASC